MNIDPNTINTEDEARSIAIEWQQWQSEQSLSYGELAEYNDIFIKLTEKFPELKEEFEENGII